jgi:hypothetical protein
VTLLCASFVCRLDNALLRPVKCVVFRFSQIWDLRSGEEIFVLLGHDGGGASLVSAHATACALLCMSLTHAHARAFSCFVCGYYNCATLGPWRMKLSLIF